MTIEEDEEIESILETYLRSRATEFSRLFNGLTAVILETISTRRITKRSVSRSLSAFKNEYLSLILSIALALSVVTSISMIGLLKNEETIPPILEVEVHSGYWGSIQIQESTSRAFKVENPTEHPLTLELKTLNWNPIMASKDLKVSWDYPGAPLPPGEATDITINIENIGLAGTILVSLDIHVVGNPY
jgi:hypothetical protein